MPTELAKLFAILLPLVGPSGPGEPDRNLPRELVLKPGDQIVAIGDSITAAGGYLRDVEAVLAARRPDLKLPKIVNMGIGGQKAEDLIGRFRKDVLDRKPAVVTISIGINDVWHRGGKPQEPQVLADYWSNVDRMVVMAQEAGVRVILLTPTVLVEMADSPGNLRLRTYIEAEKQVARDRSCTLVDLHRLFLTALPASPVPNREWLTTDGVHMAPIGDALMAIGVLRGLGLPDAEIALADTPAPAPAPAAGP